MDHGVKTKRDKTQQMYYFIVLDLHSLWGHSILQLVYIVKIKSLKCHFMENITKYSVVIKVLSKVSSP